jgi:hypothetical protein
MHGPWRPMATTVSMNCVTRVDFNLRFIQRPMMVAGHPKVGSHVQALSAGAVLSTSAPAFLTSLRSP